MTESTNKDKPALLYMATKGERYSLQELRNIEALMVFALRQGWDVQGALVEPDRPTRSAMYTEMLEDLRTGKIGAIIEWDEQSDIPTVWDTEIPGYPDWSEDPIGDADGHMHD